MSNSLDYATLDLGDEKRMNELIQEQLGRGKPRRVRQVQWVPETTLPLLPPGQLGQGQQIAARLLAIAAKCKGDRRCWQSELLATRRKATVPPISAPFVGENQTTTL